MVEIRTEVREGYEDIYNVATEKLAKLEESAKLRIDTNEEVISAREVIDRVTAEVMADVKENKTALEQIIASSTHEVEYEVEDELLEETPVEE